MIYNNGLLKKYNMIRKVCESIVRTTKSIKSNELAKMFLSFTQEAFSFVRHSPLLCLLTDLIEVAKFKDVKNKALSKRL